MGFGMERINPAKLGFLPNTKKKAGLIAGLQLCFAFFCIEINFKTEFLALLQGLP